MRFLQYLLRIAAIAVVLSIFGPKMAHAHCDGLDGPVVNAARRALEQRDLSPALIWVGPNDEAEVAEVFESVLTVRTAGGEAARLADRYFYETLVRVHRAGEGAPYTGLKPGGRDLGPAIPAADEAVASGNLKPVHDLLARLVKEGLHHRFEALEARKHYDPADVKAGREYVHSYVQFLHFTEGVYEALAAGEHGHSPAGRTQNAGEHP